MLSPIISAGYGAGKEWRDVTEKIRKQYEKGVRTFVASNEEFGDPYEGVIKYLSIVFASEGLIYSFVTAERMGAITLPFVK